MCMMRRVKGIPVNHFVIAVSDALKLDSLVTTPI
jgi:hypothetical protein